MEVPRIKKKCIYSTTVSLNPGHLASWSEGLVALTYTVFDPLLTARLLRRACQPTLQSFGIAGRPEFRPPPQPVSLAWQ